MKNRPNCIIIMDGYGSSCEAKGNAIKCAHSTNVDALMEKYPSTLIGASGMDVGLPDGQMGNSEVGHLNMGAGRIVYQELTRITKSISDGDFFTNEEFLRAIDNAKTNGKKLHLYGLLSDGGVHSHITHLYALIKLAKMQGLSDVYVHCFLDGRDVSPTSGADFIKGLKEKMEELSFGTIASVGGRYYVMDRDNRWERVEKAYDMMTACMGEVTEDAESYVRASYENGVTDEFVIPAHVVKDGKPVGLIEEGDSIIFFNFRPDRARQITRAMSEKEFDGFERKTGFINPTYVCFTRYDASFTNVSIAFKPQVLTNTLGEYIASLGLKQLRIAETEKYAHVTFFFNGGVEKPNANEDRELIPSPKVATYDLQPEMSAYEVTEKVIEKIDSDEYDVIILNFANCDMVGHTGVFGAAVKAVKTVDECVGKVVEKILEKGGNAIITADHGNADKMEEADGSPFTAHTTNKVPLIVAGKDFIGKKLRDGGILADIAPTLLDVMGVPVPEEMSGKTLIIG
ncbi:MAG: 2,3-bisphosphoglycerate-independent phosphoglycerate mutase [Clostridiales bacterium]|nr:2,3-bisphosphoglycerate-independent phosphoglycerate mutase [Clostridiales bacterium]